ncbi:HGxxPAAW family protein [Streptomyces sp. NPDC090052]|uniref:HGxxPAAW family protein n=1 Tax=unclassified Streptomyces TaxID=2593676 RepID=UPI00224D2EAF|nr:MULTISPECIES: HGxxPAAW family protein [unclassified Streptomyces]MCX4727173.1 hypothetical protein [Streptomyces sp. NBC_01306]WSV03577.1 hypothetical protein OG372_08220 [Streptomyces sp. NBC_01020]WSX41622.1 hypothetical protein OG760_07815 [Streptomyces sp. NBC_00963]WSX70419.1 hypothetical protein OG221_29595 [Streptomyces sp. NBC_00932]
MAGTSHGHTPAAWTGVIIAFIGFCVSGACMVVPSPIGVIVGLVVVVLGGVVGVAMKAAGLGMPKESEASIQARARASQAQAH